MMQWANDHWFLAAFLAYCGMSGCTQLISRLLRAMMVMVRGWPPEHLDADGDWRKAK